MFDSKKINRNYNFVIIIYINYKSLKGKVKKSIYKKYSSDEFLDVLYQYKKIKDSKKLYEINSKIERAKMGDSLRYDVLKRDKFKCQICGRTSKDNVKLEVDHIIPVSKGGKTEISNLQTLCERCNRGKSNKM